ncbi:BrnT family toxin [uncultured Thiothrix sp.]|uniref:BrnT family toxin n=1 Tax=uncultured Thiothrix sp. TaxID=223185 RepID=UPI00260F012F|nr:BrnT family toxin [uncultured Thiothrix sp.]
MMKFEWHEQKNRLNLQKHRISFEMAVLVFADPLHVSIQDRFENGEERWQTLGMVNGQLMLLVAHTIQDSEDGEVIRIISARRADPKERRLYEAANRLG